MKVVNKYKEQFDVYIGRGSPFGNPFTVKQYGRQGCIEKYREWFYKELQLDPIFMDKVLQLKGKTLGCFCKPKDCHGDVIIEYLEKVNK